MTIEMDRNKLPDDINTLKDYSINLGAKILRLEEQIALLTQKIYGRKSEKTENTDIYPDLFGKPDNIDSNEKNSEENAITIKEHKRKKGGRKKIDPNLPVDEVVVHDLTDEEKKCGSCYKKRPYLGYDKSIKIDIEPEKRKVIEHRTNKYGPCGCEESKLNEEPEIIQAKMPEKIIKGSSLEEGSLSYIMTAKFADGVPFYRLVKSLGRHGISITRQMMCQDAIIISKKCSELLNLILELIQNGISINMDETTIKVVTEENKSPNSKCYMWVMIGQTPDFKRIVYFHYDPSRSGEIPAELLKGFSGCLQTDGYKSYNASVKNNGITHAGCNAHARREFHEAYKAGKSAKIPGIALAFYRKIYKIEKEFREKLKNKKIDENTFETGRKNQTMPFFDKFKKWMIKIRPDVLPQSLTGKAITYALNEWDRLIRYLDKWHLTPDNNIAENAIRPFVIGRKNWMHAYSSDGARANACFYTLIESAKINGLNVYYYLKYLFVKLPLARSKADLLKLLPINLTNDEIMKI